MACTKMGLYNTDSLVNEENIILLQFHLQRSSRSTTTLGASLGKSLLIQISTLLSISQVSLSLTELSQVEGSNFFGLFNLLLVRLDLRLQLINQSLLRSWFLRSSSEA